jgi:sugar lactone lactonase YvrE
MSTAVRSSTIHTVAGTGENGFSGDGGRAVVACLNEPNAVTLDGQGHLLIADSENHVVRKVDRITGVITTIAGDLPPDSPQANPEPLPSGPITGSEDPFGEPQTAGTHAFAQRADLSGTVRYVVNGAGTADRFGGDGGPAGMAQLNFPTAVVVDQAGHVYIADTLNHRVRRIDATNGRITTIAGTGRPRSGGDGGPAVLAGLNEPTALAVSASGVLFVADQSNNLVRAIDLTNGFIRTVAGIGSAAYNGDGIPATEAALAGPSGLALAEDGTLYIADTFNGRIRAVDPTTGLIRTVVGDGGLYRYEGAAEPPSASLARPAGIALDNEGNLFITDSDNHLVRRWNPSTGRLERLAGVGVAGYDGDGGPSPEACLNYPFGVAVDREGAVFIADTFNHRIRKLVL